MKKLLIAGTLFFSVAASAQKPAPVKKTTTPVKKTQTTPALKNSADSMSYAIGMSLAKFYASQGIKDINPNVVSKAISDVMGNKKLALTEEQANLAIMCFKNPALCENVKSGEQFLATNKKKPNVKTTASGLQYEVLVQGTGVKPLATDTVVVNYLGTLLNGIEIDNSYKRGTPITFPLNRVIAGWTEALQLMPVGSKYKLYIPYNIAYGLNDNGQIPGGSVLVFEVELLEVKGK